MICQYFLRFQLGLLPLWIQANFNAIDFIDPNRFFDYFGILFYFLLGLVLKKKIDTYMIESVRISFCPVSYSSEIWIVRVDRVDERRHLLAVWFWFFVLISSVDCNQTRIDAFFEFWGRIKSIGGQSKLHESSIRWRWDRSPSWWKPTIYCGWCDRIPTKSNKFFLK